MLDIISWNTNRSPQALGSLLESGADLALLQEVTATGIRRLKAALPPDAVSPYQPWSPAENPTYDRWPLVVKLSERVGVDWFSYRAPTPWLSRDAVSVSCPGTLAIARVHPSGGVPFIAASAYARWFQPHPSIGKDDWIFSDASAHRIISDLSAFIASYDPQDHRILVAGDFNTNFFTSSRFGPRAMTVINRMEALGFNYLGPRYPNGRQPGGLPAAADPLRVPTYYTSSEDPHTASGQLDHVFASGGFHQKIQTTALNEPDRWGPSDHCRIHIKINE